MNGCGVFHYLYLKNSLHPHPHLISSILFCQSYSPYGVSFQVKVLNLGSVGFSLLNSPKFFQNVHSLLICVGISLQLDLWLSLDSQRFHDSRKVKPQIPGFHHSLLPALWPPAVLPPRSIFSYFSLWFMRTTHTTLLLGSHTHLAQFSSLWALRVLFHWIKSMWTLDLIQFHSLTSIDEARPCSRAVCPGKRDTDHMAAS